MVPGGAALAARDKIKATEKQLSGLQKRLSEGAPFIRPKRCVTWPAHESAGSHGSHTSSRDDRAPEEEEDGNARDALPTYCCRPYFPPRRRSCPSREPSA